MVGHFGVHKTFKLVELEVVGGRFFVTRLTSTFVVVMHVVSPIFHAIDHMGYSNQENIA